VNLHADPGKLLSDRYDIVRPLASGGMGEVLLARQINLDRLVVIKRAVNGQSGRELRALVDEAHVAARLHHPNIVSVIDVIGVAANPMVVLELVVGVSLRELIDRTPDGLPVDVALTIITDVLRGLAYAHAVSGGENVVGIVHRDVKPRNVMVTFAGVTKLIDFGISRWLEAAPTDRTTSGTRGYMAPEQERGEPVDGRADQYAAGVTLREMLSGSPLRDEPDAPTSRVIKSSALSSIVERATAPRYSAAPTGSSRTNRAPRANESAYPSRSPCCFRRSRYSPQLTATASVPMPATVSASVRLTTRSGCVSVSPSAVQPPIDCATTCARSTPAASSTVSRSSREASASPMPSPARVRPKPRWSHVMTVRSADIAAT
jgi:serine/threonine protein kinase